MGASYRPGVSRHISYYGFRFTLLLLERAKNLVTFILTLVSASVTKQYLAHLRDVFSRHT